MNCLGKLLAEPDVETGRICDQWVRADGVALRILRFELPPFGIGASPNIQLPLQRLDTLTMPGDFFCREVTLSLQQLGANLGAQQLMLEHCYFRASCGSPGQ